MVSSALSFMEASRVGSFQRALVLSQKMAAVTVWRPSPVALRNRLSATLALASVSVRSSSGGSASRGLAC